MISIISKSEEKHTLLEWNLGDSCHSHIIVFISYRISYWFYFMTLEGITLIPRKVALNIKIAFILYYKYDHDNNDDATDHIVSCSWKIISLVTVMSKLKLKKEDRIHNLRENLPLFLNILYIGKGQLKKQNCVIRNAWYSSWSSPTLFILKYKAQYEIFHLYKYWFNDYCVPRNEVHSISVSQTVYHIHIPNNFWQQYCPFLIPPKKKKK